MIIDLKLIGNDCTKCGSRPIMERSYAGTPGLSGWRKAYLVYCPKCSNGSNLPDSWGADASFVPSNAVSKWNENNPKT